MRYSNRGFTHRQPPSPPPRDNRSYFVGGLFQPVRIAIDCRLTWREQGMWLPPRRPSSTCLIVVGFRTAAAAVSQAHGRRGTYENSGGMGLFLGLRDVLTPLLTVWASICCKEAQTSNVCCAGSSSLFAAELTAPSSSLWFLCPCESSLQHKPNLSCIFPTERETARNVPPAVLVSSFYFSLCS